MRIIMVLLLTLLLSSCASISEKEPVDYVDHFLGTSSSRWMLYPGPSMPFGLVKLSPDNVETWTMDAGYEYTIESIAGFGHIHSWAMGSFLTMPTTGPININPGSVDNPDDGYRSRFDHKNESASPGYYSVFLDDYDIRAELTATTRTGIQRYTFPKTGSAHVLFDLQIPEEDRPMVLSGAIDKVSNTEITGHVRRATGWNDYTLYFVARFNHPIRSMDVWKGDSLLTNTSNISIDEHVDFGAVVNFSTQEENIVVLKTGVSLVSIEQARLNLENETKEFGWDFDAAREHTRATWNALLSKIIVEGGSETDKIKFYTNMYRSYCARTIFSDVDGKYIDMCENVQQLPDPESPIYGCDAFWNTFWNLNQLWALVTPRITNSWVNSLLEIYDKGGWLSKGPAGIEYSSIMVASHEIALIVASWQMGIRDFDVEKAYRAIKEIQTIPGSAHECGGYPGNRNLETYMDIGYVPIEEGPISNTLEYAYDDWCVAQLAKSLGKTDDYDYFLQRSQNYRNAFDPSTGYMRAKYKGGPWVEDFQPVIGAVGKEDNFGSRHYVEGNAWQFTWFAPHDVPGLVDLIGKEEFNSRLNTGFENAGNFVSEYVNHSNQPNMQAAWLFNYSGKPWLTQYWVREIMDKYYGTGPVNGYPGDEDQGQMGAWYVMSAMGLFQMDGGASTSPAYELSGPIFEKIIIQLDQNYYPGKSFIIEAKNASQKNRYIQSAKLNGQELKNFWFSCSELTQGGSLVVEMGAKPNKEWGVSELPARSEFSSIVTTPYVSSNNTLFIDSTKITLTCDTKNARINYTTDDSIPKHTSNVYSKPFVVKETTVLRMRAFVGENASLPATKVIEKAELKKPVSPGDVLPGLLFNYYKGFFRSVNDFKTIQSVNNGVVDSFSLDPRDQEQYFGFTFSGYLDVPKQGLYTFYLASNDGAVLSLDGRILIDHDGLHPASEKSQKIALSRGLHEIEVNYFQEGGTNLLKVSWHGPGFEKQMIPAQQLYHK